MFRCYGPELSSKTQTDKETRPFVCQLCLSGASILCVDERDTSYTFKGVWVDKNPG